MPSPTTGYESHLQLRFVLDGWTGLTVHIRAGYCSGNRTDLYFRMMPISNLGPKTGSTD